MWVRVEVCDDNRKQLIGRLDNEPLNDYEGKLDPGSQVVVDYDNIRGHPKPTEFTPQ
jgi:hypothetical protein